MAPNSLIRSLSPAPQRGQATVTSPNSARLLPVVSAIGYELIKLSSRHNGHILVRMLTTPGLWLQRLTTREPDDAMVEVAIAALQRVMTEESAEAESVASPA